MDLIDGKTEINNFYKKYDELFDRQNFSELARYVEKWLEKAELLKLPELYIVVANELGGIYRVTGQTERAVKLYNTVLDRLISIGEYNTDNYATALINYGDVFIVSCEMEKALELFTKAECILERNGHKQDYLMAALYNNMSYVYMHIKKYDEAEKVLKSALAIVSNDYRYERELATTHISLGEVLIEKGNAEEAKLNFEKAMKIYDSLEPKDPHYAAAIAGMGKVYLLMDDYNRAISSFDEACEMIKNSYGENGFYDSVNRNLEFTRSIQEKKIERNKRNGSS